MKIINWEEYFMGVARLSSMRSKDPNTQTGACIVNDLNRIIGVGYNGMPGGKDQLPWKREGDFEDTKYAYVIHAETNAILNAVREVRGATMYATLFPCNECAKIIVATGIKKVIYDSDKYHDEKMTIVSRKILDLNGIKYQKVSKINLEIK